MITLPPETPWYIVIAVAVGTFFWQVAKRWIAHKMTAVEQNFQVKIEEAKSEAQQASAGAESMKALAEGSNSIVRNMQEERRDVKEERDELRKERNRQAVATEAQVTATQDNTRAMSDLGIAFKSNDERVGIFANNVLNEGKQTRTKIDGIVLVVNALSIRLDAVVSVLEGVPNKIKEDIGVELINFRSVIETLRRDLTALKEKTDTEQIRAIVNEAIQARQQDAPVPVQSLVIVEGKDPQ